MESGQKVRVTPIVLTKTFVHNLMIQACAREKFAECSKFFARKATRYLISPSIDKYLKRGFKDPEHHGDFWN